MIMKKWMWVNKNCTTDGEKKSRKYEREKT